MNTKHARELHGPSWTEVILGAILSLALGVVLAAGYLVFKPVVPVKEMPKEPAAGVVYYIEGTRGGNAARQATAKQRSFLQGESVALNEGELNALAAPATPPAEAAKASSAAMVSAGVPNFRIHDGELQIAVPMNVSLSGFAQQVMVQARGGFEREGETFVFAPNEVLVGSCPLQRLPAAQGILMKRFFASLAMPEEIATAWRGLANVSIEGSTLRLER